MKKSQLIQYEETFEFDIYRYMYEIQTKQKILLKFFGYSKKDSQSVSIAFTDFPLPWNTKFISTHFKGLFSYIVSHKKITKFSSCILHEWHPSLSKNILPEKAIQELSLQVFGVVPEKKMSKTQLGDISYYEII